MQRYRLELYRDRVQAHVFDRLSPVRAGLIAWVWMLFAQKNTAYFLDPMPRRRRPLPPPESARGLFNRAAADAA